MKPSNWKPEFRNSKSCPSHDWIWFTSYILSSGSSNTSFRTKNKITINLNRKYYIKRKSWTNTWPLRKLMKPPAKSYRDITSSLKTDVSTCWRSMKSFNNRPSWSGSPPLSVRDLFRIPILKQEELLFRWKKMWDLQRKVQWATIAWPSLTKELAAREDQESRKLAEMMMIRAWILQQFNLLWV